MVGGEHYLKNSALQLLRLGIDSAFNSLNKRITYQINELTNYKYVYRKAQATPGLLIIWHIDFCLWYIHLRIAKKIWIFLVVHLPCSSQIHSLQKVPFGAFCLHFHGTIKLRYSAVGGAQVPLLVEMQFRFFCPEETTAYHNTFSDWRET